MNMTGKLMYKQTYLSGSNGGKAGENNVSYDGKTLNGDILGSGAYIFKVIQGNHVVGGGKIAIIR